MLLYILRNYKRSWNVSDHSGVTTEAKGGLVTSASLRAFGVLLVTLLEFFGEFEGHLAQDIGSNCYDDHDPELSNTRKMARIEARTRRNGTLFVCPGFSYNCISSFS